MEGVSAKRFRCDVDDDVGSKTLKVCKNQLDTAKTETVGEGHAGWLIPVAKRCVGVVNHAEKLELS